MNYIGVHMKDNFEKQSHKWECFLAVGLGVLFWLFLYIIPRC